MSTFNEENEEIITVTEFIPVVSHSPLRLSFCVSPTPLTIDSFHRHFLCFLPCSPISLISQLSPVTIRSQLGPAVFHMFRAMDDGWRAPRERPQVRTSFWHEMHHAVADWKRRQLSAVQSSCQEERGPPHIPTQGNESNVPLFAANHPGQPQTNVPFAISCVL